ncbi:hypothetical protein D0Z07_0092, partial [Hyphodiscus hymeniophilus]
MKALAIILMIVAAATAVAAQQLEAYTYNSTTGIFTCPANNPNGAFCADTSLSSSIIIRCSNGIGQPGNCNDNLSGEPPFDVWYAPCWQTSTTSGDAACSKNCVVYGASGNANGTFTLPDCTPEDPISSSTTASSLLSSSTSISTTSATAITTSVPASSVSSSSTSVVSSTTERPATDGEDMTVSLIITATFTTICSAGSSIYTSSYTTTKSPSIDLSPSVVLASVASYGSSPLTSSKSSSIVTAPSVIHTSVASPGSSPFPSSKPTSIILGTGTGFSTGSV